MEYPKFKVCARCFTFNQSKYIIDTMNGFIMQKTDFPFVCCIVDDASTDGEQEVIMSYVKENFNLSEGSDYYQKETDYAHITYAQHKTNANCYFAVLLLKENHYSKHKPKQPYLAEWMDCVPYIALCEGDDYWIDSLKLQKQIEYLRQNPKVNIVTHNAYIIYSDGTQNPFNTHVKTGVYNLRQCLYKPWFTPTASFLYRNNYELSPLWAKNGSNGDMACLYSNLMKGDLFYSNEIMSVYDYGTPNSMSANTQKSILYKKKRAMLKTINQLTQNRTILLTFPFQCKLYIKQFIVEFLDSIRIRK